MERCDVLIVGSGTAGATAAWMCGRRGLRVLLIDRRPRERVGAHWINGVERSLFDRLELGDPNEPVVFHEGGVFHLEAPGGYRVCCDNVPIVDVDMGPLTEMLLDGACASGAGLLYEHRLESLIVANGRVEGARLRGPQGVEVVRAPVTVDASGLDGVVRKQLPPSAWQREPMDAPDICVAAQQVREITDREAANAFLEAQRIDPGDVLCWAGLAGGYSILNASVFPERGIVSFLTGAMIARGKGSAVRLLEEGLRRTGFAGKRISGGAGLIPVRRAFDRLVGEGYALLGDAASQVFPAHGSGVAAGMLAAEMLARAIAGALGATGPTTAGLWPYAAEYQRTRGALCASNEWVRRLTEGLDAPLIDAMVKNGALNARAIRRSMACRSPRLSAGQLVGAGRALLGAPRLTGRIMATAARAALVKLHYQRYPKHWDPARFAAWRRRTAQLF